MPSVQHRNPNLMKPPRQARSAATVGAIFEATIQVLLAEGASRLTTTRVAERAGVSVGTLYQYFPHKQALLHALLQRHLWQIGDAVEAACARLHGAPTEEIAAGLATAYLDAKTLHVDLSRAFCLASGEVDGTQFAAEMSARIRAALRALLASCSDGAFADIDTVAFVLQQALLGTVRGVLESEGGPSPAALALLYEQLPILCSSYLLQAHRKAAA